MSIFEKTLQDRLRERADWHRGVNRPTNQPRPPEEIKTADLLDEAARAIDFAHGIRR